MMWLMGLPSFMTEVLLCLVAGLAMGTVMLMPTWIFVARWRKAHDRYQRWKTNHCIACGYDLRAHKPGDKCPECGTLIPEQSQTELRA
ncbi:MAG: hypothetical protein FWD53_00950 [Phycisphaerales bacterium]|nr:hypothetical protein [Phycisphaerales bacterium]